MITGLMLEFMGIELFMFRMAKINIFSLLATFPNDFKRNAYFCSKLEFLNLEILKFEI